MIGPHTQNLIDLVQYKEINMYKERNYNGGVIVIDPPLAALIRREGTITAITSVVSGKELHVDHRQDGSLWVYVTPFLCATGV